MPSRKEKRAIVISTISAVVVFLMAGRSAGQAEVNAPAPVAMTGSAVLDAKRISFYQVPLTCPAVPQIGCGSASKPLLLELEKSGIATEAWLNRAGTLLAVVWSEHSKRKQRSNEVKIVSESNQITVKPVTGKSRLLALDDFRSGVGWYRGAEVDRLSAEEAGINAAKWVGRIRAKITLSNATAKVLQDGFTTAIQRKLTGQITREQAKAEMLDLCRARLSSKDMAVLQEAFQNELRAPKGTE